MLRFSIFTKPNLFFLAAATLLNAGALAPKWEAAPPFKTFNVAPATGFAVHVLPLDQARQGRTTRRPPEARTSRSGAMANASCLMPRASR